MTQKQGFILVFQIRIGLNPFYFGNPIPDLFQETDPGKQKIRLNHGKFQENQPKSQEFYIYNNIFMIHKIKKIKIKLGRIRSWIWIHYSTKRIRILIKRKRIRNPGLFTYRIQCDHNFWIIMLCLVKVVKMLLKLLEDKNGEVQNLAVR